MVIYKYELSPSVFDGPTPVSLPQRRRVLDVQVKNGAVLLWALVDESSPTKPFWAQVYGTGWHIDQPQEPSNGQGPPALFYFKTIHDGVFVWHVFTEDQ